MLHTPTPAKPASLGWQVVDRLDWARHHVSSGFDTERHYLADIGSTTASAFDTTRHTLAHAGSDIASFFGFGGGGGSPPPHPAVSQTQEGTKATPGWTSVLGGMGGQGKIPAPDTSALKTAKTKVTEDLKQIDQALTSVSAHPGKIPAPDVSDLETAKTKVTQDLKQIDQALTASAAGKPVHVAAPDLSALVSAAGKAGADGRAISQGLASGILSGEGAAVAAANQVASAVTAIMAHALQTHSPSKVTEKIGQDTSAGLAKGLTDGKSAVKAAATEIGSDSVASLIQGLEGGQSNQQNVATALTGALANPDAVTTIQQTVQELLADIPAGKDTGLVKWLGAQQSKLSGLANQQGALMAQITDAQQVATSQISNAGITGAYGYTPALAASSGPTAAPSVIQGMQQQAADQAQFAQQLAQLKGQGLNATSLSQIAGEGASAGLPLALGLAQGGKGAVSQVNALEAQIIKSSQQIGDVGGTAMYQAGLAVTSGLDTALKASLKQVGKEMAAEATEITTEVEKKLGTKASSSSSSSSSGTAASAASTAGASATAAGGLGKISAAGAAAASGLDKAGSAGGTAASGLDKVASAAGSAASALNRIASHGSGSGSGSGAQVVNITNNITVQGTVMSENDLFGAMQNASLRAGSNNWQTGLIFPGRHT